MNKFTAFDVETTNSHNDRICSIWLVYIVDNDIIGSAHFFVNPETTFSPRNIATHGITPKMVKDEQTFDKLCDELLELLAIMFWTNVKYLLLKIDLKITKVYPDIILSTEFNLPPFV